MASGGAKPKTVVKAKLGKEKTAVMSDAMTSRLGEEKAAEISDLLKKLKVQECGGQDGAAKFDEDVGKSMEELNPRSWTMRSSRQSWKPIQPSNTDQWLS